MTFADQLTALRERYAVLRGTSPNPEAQIIADLFALASEAMTQVRLRNEQMSKPEVFMATYAIATDCLKNGCAHGERPDTLRAECERLKADNENLVWNLAGCDTIASSQQPQDFTHEGARPALYAVQRLAVECERLLAAAENAPWKASYMAMRDERDRLTARVAEVERESDERARQCGEAVRDAMQEKLHHADLAAGALKDALAWAQGWRPGGMKIACCWCGHTKACDVDCRIGKALSTSPATIAGEVRTLVEAAEVAVSCNTGTSDAMPWWAMELSKALAPVVARWVGK